ncbi:uncharacterized protein LOC131851702 [Achroia grisella]|uniref:uncharacterized protein LOC131851702 n=1 Tax=Achroia grisella TaxID=688607 RepID=UPI0027D30871|nr:uncharacterized protein LOC131851702 [Achroia grisella]
MAKKNKGGSKANVFKVAGAKSLKKSKAKAVNLGLKNLKQKVSDIDKQFLEISKNPKSNEKIKPEMKTVQKKTEKNITKEEVSDTAEKIVKMDL